MSERMLQLSGTKRGVFIKGNGMTMYTVQRIKSFSLLLSVFSNVGLCV